ncbi:unnamed protein product [Rotaria sp. Silwood2]|nr:unnamed protein product [Rotaria sp. Silwood2]
MIREKITDFLTYACWPSKVRKLVTGLVRAIIMGDPVETLKYLLPKTCESINKIMNDPEGNALLTDHKGDKELTWYLVLFSELVRVRGDALMIYKEMIISVFHQCIQIIHKGSYKAVASAAKHLLKSLTHIYMINTRLTVENIDGPFIDFLPIRAWGQPVDVDKVQVQFHIPNDDELDFVREFVETFLYVELDLLKEKSSKLSNGERLRSLTIVHHIAIGCFRIVSRIGSPNVQNLVPTVVPYSAQSQAQYSMYFKEPKFRENLRWRLLINIGKLLDMLVDNQSDDVSSIKMAHKIYSAISIGYGVSKQRTNELHKEFQSSKQLIKNRLCGERQNPRFLTMKRISLQIELFEMIEYGTLTEIDKQVALKLFELSINRYSEIRRHAQIELFSVLSRYRFSLQVIVDRIIELLNTSSEVDHDQFKYATKGIAAICRLQKPPRIYVEKSFDELLHENKKQSSTVIMRDECNPGDRNDNFWVTIDGYKPPETQTEWEQMCFLDKTFHGYYTWPKVIKYPMNKRARYTQNDMPEQVAIIYNRFIDKNFIIQSTKLMISDENTDEIMFIYVRFTMFKCLFRNFGLAFVDNFMEQLYVLIHEKTHEKQEGSHRVAAEIVAGMIRGSKYWTLEMVSRNVSFSTILTSFDHEYERSLDELWKKLKPFLTEVCLNLSSATLRHWNTCFKCVMEHGDPRRMYRLIDFIRTLINNQISSNTFNETSRWSLIQTLKMFQWRIPSIWCTIYEHAKELLDHSFKPVREHIAE